MKEKDVQNNVNSGAGAGAGAGMDEDDDGMIFLMDEHNEENGIIFTEPYIKNSFVLCKPKILAIKSAAALNLPKESRKFY